MRGKSKKVPVRPVKLDEEFADVPRLFAHDGDLIVSHVVAALSSVFPDGEDFFVRSVRHYKDRIEDPELNAAVLGFIGQEVTHGREHRAFNAHLDSLGYHTKFVERLTRRGIAFRERHSPAIANLASTAALEHFTATLAELVMTSEETRESFGHEAVRNLFLWHALEEAEHKAVAFDVYQAVGGGERLRILMMKIARYAFVVSMSIQVILGLLLDRETYKPGRLRKSLAYTRKQPLFSRESWNQLKAYERKGFHPDDRPTGDLVELWRERLFGVDGAMTESVRGAA
ncbi:MAG: metal-dependent hydrolase [Frankiaceae bacterium]|nr:metal-dependent hydrolase [Frankiaceae bacterium]MBV9872651.1 metal-dependent hydrolase [Frankiaceae bacterium]